MLRYVTIRGYAARYTLRYYVTLRARHVIGATLMALRAAMLRDSVRVDEA